MAGYARPWDANYPQSTEDYRREINSLLQHYFAPKITQDTLEEFRPPLITWRTNIEQVLKDFQSDVNYLIEHYSAPESTIEKMGLMLPRINLAESETAYEVTVEMPGMEAEEINVEIKENELWITGERKQQKQEGNKIFSCVENRYGRFQRVVPFTSAIQEDQVEADYTNGVLSITIPKSEKVQTTRIDLKNK